MDSGGVSMPHYDNFISYRRAGASEQAKMIFDALREQGLTAFYDRDSLRSGVFDERLIEAIDGATNVILLLGPGALDRCSNPEDWLRREIVEALDRHKNIVPVFINGFVFPDELPSGLEGLSRINGIEFDLEYFDSFIQKLTTRFLNAGDVAEMVSDAPEDFMVEGGTLIRFLGRGRKVVIPAGVRTIGEQAFKDATRVEEVVLPDGLESMEDGAFERCNNLTRIVIPDSVTRIGRRAFSRCYELAYVDMGLGLRYVLDEAFSFCTRLTQLEVGPAVEYFVSSAVNGCSKLARIEVNPANTHFVSTDGVLYTAGFETLVRCPEATKLGEIVVDARTRELAAWSFSACNNVTQVSLPVGLRRICAHAFEDCQRLARVTIPDATVEVELDAFLGWSSGQEIVWGAGFEPPNDWHVGRAAGHEPLDDSQAPTSEFMLVKTVFEAYEEAESMARMLLDAHLIVSGQIGHIQSLYIWEREFCSEAEIELTCFTTRRNYPAVEAFIKSRHSYEVAEIIGVPILGTTDEFGAWIRDYVTPGAETSDATTSAAETSTADHLAPETSVTEEEKS
ncbi:MAG TPA: hypothetical protein DD645_05725 [Olsenella sp.]|nr:hypothetical protein [Olsenella sp.]